MGDAADKVTSDDERAMALFEEQRQQRIAASMQGYDPSKPVNCFDCGDPVPEERLKAYPRTGRCTPCATEVERGYRRGIPT